MGFVCAFRGRRDSYQVPIALAQAGQLDLFITDHFAGPAERALARLLPQQMSERVLSRYDERIPQDRVRRLFGIAGAEALARLAGVPAAHVYSTFDPMYGSAVARYARRHKSDLFVYSPYAFEAFSAAYRHLPRKILFQFHPHFRLENAILVDDMRDSERQGIFFDGQLESGATDGNDARQRGDLAWQLADHVVCASSFTKRSLVEAGADAAHITVIPYGVGPEAVPALPHGLEGNGFHALFVGSGVQRKGLHHLLLAWRRARLTSRSRLTVVSRTIDPGLFSIFQAVDNVNLLNGVTESELSRLYNSATLFVMPSLVEGFGQVYLEALSHGLPVLGTANSCLPDLGNENDGVFVTAPANLDELVSKLETLAPYLVGNSEIKQRARTCAAQFTWERFRKAVQTIVHKPDRT